MTIETLENIHNALSMDVKRYKGIALLSKGNAEKYKGNKDYERTAVQDEANYHRAIRALEEFTAHDWR